MIGSRTNEHVISQNNLGFFVMRREREVDKTYKKPYGYYRLAADQVHVMHIIIFGFVFEKGEGVEEDLNDAVTILSIGATKEYALHRMSLFLLS